MIIIPPPTPVNADTIPAADPVTPAIAQFNLFASGFLDVIVAVDIFDLGLLPVL